MKCSKCSRKAAIATAKPFCSEHFVTYFEEKVAATVSKFNLIRKNDKIAVASSGGKDSTALLYILNKYFGNVEALAIDEGIPGYRNLTLEDLEKFCCSSNIPLHIYRYEEEFGFTITEALKAVKGTRPCNVCGTLRRYLLNSKAKNYDKIATGHNIDDEAQSIMMNLVKAQVPLLSRLGPITNNAEKNFVPRIKPLYFCSEKEVAAYAVIKNLGVKFSQCPHSAKSFRAFIRDKLNEYETKNRGSKATLVGNFLKMLPQLRQQQAESTLSQCSNCGEAANNNLCKACSFVNSISETLATPAN